MLTATETRYPGSLFPHPDYPPERWRGTVGRWATHEEVKLYLLTHDGPWWVPAPAEPGQAHVFGIVTVTPPPTAYCVHCGKPADLGIGAAEVTVAGTDLLWLAGHCGRCFDADPRCPETCTFL